MREMLSYLDSPAGPLASAAFLSTHPHVGHTDPARVVVQSIVVIIIGQRLLYMYITLL